MLDVNALRLTNPLAPAQQIVEALAPELRYTDHHTYVIREAQRRLAGRTQEEIQKGGTYLADLYQSVEQSAFVSANKKMEAGSTQERINDPIGFLELFEQHELYEKPDFPGATPATYFALLALTYALESLGYISQIQEPKAREQAGISSELITRSREIIAFIQGMEFEGIFRRKISRAGNKAKNSKRNLLKAKIFEFADTQCGGLSSREAGRRAYKEFQKECDDVLRTDDPEHRLEIWIGQHRKSQKQ